MKSQHAEREESGEDEIDNVEPLNQAQNCWLLDFLFISNKRNGALSH